MDARQWHDLGSILTSPGFCDEQLHLFLATDLSKGNPTHEAHKFIEIHWLSINKVEQLVHSGEMDDAKSIVTLYKLQKHLARS